MNDVDRDALAMRDLYRHHESTMAGAGERLMPAVLNRRRRQRNRQRLSYATVAIVVIATLVGVASMLGGAKSTQDPHRPAAIGAVDHQVPPPGYRLERSLGAQVAVPLGWRVNDVYHCHSDNLPTIVRSPGDFVGCGQNTLTKELAFIVDPRAWPMQPMSAQLGYDVAHLPTHAVIIDGVAATRSVGKVRDGMYAGWVIVPSRNVAVFAHTRTATTLTTILDSVHLVSVDNVGCPTDRPLGKPTAAGRSTFVDPHPVSISVCYYGGDPVLQASIQHMSADAVALSTALNASAPGVNPTPGNSGCNDGSATPSYDALLLIRSADGTAHTVTARFEACANNRLDNGAGFRQLPQPLVEQIMADSNVGYLVASP